MENKIIETVNEVNNVKGIKGFVCTDENGFPIAVSGEAPKEAPGYVCSLAATAEKLSEEKPSILIETDSRKILIKRDNNITIAVYTEKKNS